MKDHVMKLASIALVSALLSISAHAEVYKVVDEDGNVTYTDQPPGPDALAVELPGLSIISPQVTPKPRKAVRAEPTDGSGEITSLRDLRRGYRDFAIAAPANDETLWPENGQVQVAWVTEYALQPGMMVVVYLDGVAQPPATGPAINLGRVDRGSHTIYAELMDRQNRRIATSPSITFHLRQHSVLSPARQAQGG